MKPFNTVEDFYNTFKPISYGKWSIEKTNNTLKVFNDSNGYILPIELDLKLLDHVQDGEYTVVSLFGTENSRVKAGGLIRFCNKFIEHSQTYLDHYELTFGGNEYVRSICGKYDVSYNAYSDTTTIYYNT